jgi:hypothetical protein
MDAQAAANRVRLFRRPAVAAAVVRELVSHVDPDGIVTTRSSSRPGIVNSYD